MQRAIVLVMVVGLLAGLPLVDGVAAEAPSIDVWPGLAPGETGDSRGTVLERRAGEDPPATRVGSIVRATMDVYPAPADRRNGAAVIIMPGGGYNYVVVDKEGSEVAQRLNESGITGFVLRYRTKDGTERATWERALQDAQRAVRLVRTRADEWQLDPERIGVMGFSAGGHLGALAATRFDEPSYDPVDAIDRVSCRPDFALLLYPAYLYDEERDALSETLTVGPRTPPTFLVHAHNDRVTSLSSIYFYAALKKLDLPAEVHVYQNGGHGYGLRPVEGSVIHTWMDRAEDWLTLTLPPR